MEERYSLYKGKRVVKWLRFGYTFFKKARIGYDLAWNDEDMLTGLIFGYHLPVSLHIHSADLGNR